jgi:uncharacterized phage protein (TIGR01671 family)
MREIKFRIYDPYSDTVGVFRFSGSTPSMLSVFFEKFATLDTVHGQKWEQYTGIKDKNGREIYEGDVIKANGWGNSHSWSNWSRNDADINTRRVAWSDGSYVLLLPNEDRVTQGFKLCKSNQNRFEIVGNIHETGNV